MGFTPSRYLRTTAANKVEDITKAAAFADLATASQGAHVADPAASANDLTDSTGGSASGSQALTAGVGKCFVAILFDLTQIANGDLLTTYTPGFKGRILKVDAHVHTVVSTGGKAADINLEIGTTDLTGGVVGLTSANCAAMGAQVAGSSVTDTNTFSSSDTISIEAANVTAFAEGSVWLVIALQNDDTMDAFATIAAEYNSLKDDVEANNAVIDSILSSLETLTLLATS